MNGFIKHRSSVKGSALLPAKGQMLLTPETDDCITNRKGMSTKCLDHTSQRNWRAFILGVYLPINNRRCRRLSARAASKSTRTTHLITLGGWSESNLSMGHRLGGLRVWCGQPCCRRRVVLKGESGLSPNAQMKCGDDEELTCGVSDMLHVLSRALFWILGDTEENWRMVGV